MPRKSISRIEYEKRVNRVIDYITSHQSEDLSLEVLAGVAAFSPYHFHRIFKSISGENLNEFIARVRIEKAANMLLVRPSGDVLGIALDNGFNSASAFSRAFKEHFGMSATEWREGGGLEWKRRSQNSNLSKEDSKGGKDQDLELRDTSFMSETQEDKVNVKIKSLPAYHVAYMRHIGPYGPEVVKMWQKFMQWMDVHGLKTDDRISLGLSYDNPRVTAPEKCRYDACIVVPKDFKPDSQVNIADIPSGKYAVVEFRGTAAETEKPYTYLYKWLPNSGFQPDNRPCLELYVGDAEMNEKTGTLKCDICMPIRPL